MKPLAVCTRSAILWHIKLHRLVKESWGHFHKPERTVLIFNPDCIRAHSQILIMSRLGIAHADSVLENNAMGITDIIILNSRNALHPMC